MRTILIALALCAAPSAFAQAPLIPITPGQDMSSIGGFYGSVGSYDCTGNRRQATAERAIEVCTQIIDSNADREQVARALVARGDRYEDLGQVDQANADFERSLALYSEQIAEAPRTPQGYVGRAWVHMRLNRVRDALADATFATEVDDGHGPAFYMRAQANFLLGQYELAAADFDRTARIAQRMASQGSLRAPGSPQAYVSPRVLAGRCEARAAAGVELGIAETACRAAMRNSASEVFSRGFLRFKQGRYEEAWADFNAAYEEEERTDGYALYGRGVSAVRLGRQAEGEADIAQARQMEGNDLDGYVRAGLVP